MNPNGNLWSMLKKRLGKMNYSAEEHMVTNVIKVWFHSSAVKNICSKQVEPMPKCIQEVISAKGGHIPY
jgi:hypothetical protein